MAEDSSPLARFDRDEAFRARITAAYQADRPRFISTVITLAVSEGYGRRESAEFAIAVCSRVRESIVETAVMVTRVGPSITDCLEAAMRADPQLTIEEAIRVVPISAESIRLSQAGHQWRGGGNG